jgi:hypothetical protein
MDAQDQAIKALYSMQSVLRHSYDLSPIKVEDLMSSPGFAVQICHYAHILEKHPDMLGWDLKKMGRAMRKEGMDDFSSMGYASYHLRKRAESSGLERGRLNYGIQVAKNIGIMVEKLAGIRAIGAESRLGARDDARGISDLDLCIDPNAPLEQIDVANMFVVRRDAEKKTGIKVDLVGPGLPITQSSAEHLMSFFDDPLPIRGFPVMWRDQRYLDELLFRKNHYFSSQMAVVAKINEDLKSKGMRIGTVLGKHGKK